MENLTIYEYEKFFEEKGDKRAEHWVFMKDPMSTLWLLAGYFTLVYIIIPIHMKNRKPYNLKTVIQFYNIFQIISCIYLIYEISTSGWTTELSLGCEPIDYSNRPNAIRLLHCTYWYFLLKIIELVETVFFALRKKQSQITKLHVYHHTSMVLLGWIGVKFFGGGMSTFPILLNSFIHALMYTYYFLSALGPKMQKKLNFIKPKLTMMQMIQFTIIVIHASQALREDCPIHNGAVFIFIPNILVIFSFFINFYIKKYTSKLKEA